MWKSMKKFFKWIADHMGISWVFKRFSSNQRSDDKMSRTNQSKNRASNSLDNRVSNLLQDKPGVFDVIRKGNDRYLVLHVGANYVSKVVCESVENIKESLSGYPVYIECDKGVFKVTLGRVLFSNAFYSSFNVCSMTPYACNTLYNGLEEMKSMLGLSEPVIITRILKDLKVLSDKEIPNSAVVDKSNSKKAKLVPSPKSHNFVLREKLEMEKQFMKMQAERGFIDEEGDKWFDAEEPSSTAEAPATEALATKVRHITNPSTGGNGYY